MDLRRLGAGEWLAAASGVALLLSLFLPWYTAGGPQDSVCVASYGDVIGGGVVCGDVSGWEAFSVLDVLLALVAASGVLLAVVTAAQGVPAVPVALSALVALVGIVGVILVLFRVLDIPDWAGGRAWALWLGLAGSLGIVAGSILAMRDEIRPDAVQPDIEALPAPRP